MASRNAKALGQLAEWGERFNRVASRGYKGALTKEMSKATLALIEEGFRKESTPYGSKWRPKKVPNGEQILMAHSNPHMRYSFRAMTGIGKFVITNPKPYTDTHQYGDSTRNIPRRQMWPDPNRLPAKYIRTYTRIFQDATFRIIMKGKKP